MAHVLPIDPWSMSNVDGSVGKTPLAMWVLCLCRPDENRSKLVSMRGIDSSMPSRRWLLGIEPFFEGGWFHKGARGQSWDVEERLGAISVLGDVTVDLTNPRTLPASIGVQAYAIGRDVEVLVRPGARVELSGRANNGHLNNEVAEATFTDDDHVIKISGHTFLGDVNVRAITAKATTGDP